MFHTIYSQYDIMHMLAPNQWTYFPQDILHLPTLKKHQPWPNFSATHHISQCHHVCHICTYIHSISYFLSWFPHLKLYVLSDRSTTTLCSKIRKFVRYQHFLYFPLFYQKTLQKWEQHIKITWILIDYWNVMKFALPA